MFNCLTALPQPWGRAVIAYNIFVRNTIICSTVGKLNSNPVLFTAVVCYTGILKYTSDKLAIQLLLI